MNEGKGIWNGVLGLEKWSLILFTKMFTGVSREFSFLRGFSMAFYFQGGDVSNVDLASKAYKLGYCMR